MVKTVRMKFITAEVHRKIINQELFDKISKVNILDGQYEEIPLITRYKSVDFLKDYFSSEEISLYLVSMAQMLLFDSRTYFRKLYSSTEKERIFSCLTFVDFDDEVDDVGFCIPNLFFSTLSTVEYLNNPLDAMGFNNRFATTYAPILKDQQVKIYKTITEQGGVTTNRIYLVFPDGCNGRF